MRMRGQASRGGDDLKTDIKPSGSPLHYRICFISISFIRKMTHLRLEPSLLDSLAGKVAVLTGGATGIGRSTVQQLCSEFNIVTHD